MANPIGLHAEHLLAPAVATREALSLDEIFEQLYRAAWPKVYAFLRSQVPTTEIAQDLVSRVFVKAYGHRAQAPEGAAAMLWVFRIAHTTLIDYWRVEGRRAAASISFEELIAVPGTTGDPEAAYALKERQAALLRTMGDLPEQDRVLLALKFAGQRTNREIAAILDLSDGAVSMRLLRALQRLRARLQELGIT